MTSKSIVAVTFATSLARAAGVAVVGPSKQAHRIPTIDVEQSVFSATTSQIPDMPHIPQTVVLDAVDFPPEIELPRRRLLDSSKKVKKQKKSTKGKKKNGGEIDIIIPELSTAVILEDSVAVVVKPGVFQVNARAMAGLLDSTELINAVPQPATVCAWLEVNEEAVSNTRVCTSLFPETFTALEGACVDYSQPGQKYGGTCQCTEAVIGSDFGLSSVNPNNCWAASLNFEPLPAAVEVDSGINCWMMYTSNAPPGDVCGPCISAPAPANNGFNMADGFYVGRVVDNSNDACLLSSGIGNLFSELSTFATLALDEDDEVALVFESDSLDFGLVFRDDEPDQASASMSISRVVAVEEKLRGKDFGQGPVVLG